MRGAAMALVVVAVTSADTAAAQVLEPYYMPLPVEVIDPSYRPDGSITTSADLDGDGNQDFVLLGRSSRGTASNHYRPQPGRVFLGDGDGGFRRAPAELFPVDTLNTVHPRNAPFGDLNGDGLPDMFIAGHGWDAQPFPGEQNRLYLSRPGGGWRDATSELPQLSDFSHSAAIGDIRGLGTPDIIVGNIWGQNGILPYALLNRGNGSFSLDRTILPVGDGETMNFNRGHLVTGTVLTDLDGDGLPELIAAGGHGNPGSFVFWNRAGAFSEEDKTALPTPAPFVDGHIDLDAAAIDADGDGLLDLVVVGTQEDPFYDGWFVQLLMNRGDGTFADETSLRLQPDEQSSGNAGVATNTPWARWVDVIDFNGDGAADFVMSPFGDPRGRPNLPLIWLNDGSGRFSALKVHDFVRPADEWLFFAARLVRTRHGYSYISMQTYPGSGGLILAGLLATRPYRDRPTSANRPPTAVGTLPDREMTLGGTLGLDVSPAFVDPDGDALTYTVSSSAPHVATVLAAGARVTVTAVGLGRATISAMATDRGGLSAAQTFTVSSLANRPFTDHPIVPGETPVRAVHFTELRTRIDALRAGEGLGRFTWTDSDLRAGVTRVRLVHLLELRSALAASYSASGRSAPSWTDAGPVAGTTPVRAVHLMELRAAVLALE